MKTKLFLLCIFFVLLICSVGLFDFDVNISGRIIVIGIYLFVITLTKFVFKNNLVNMVSTLSYYDNFDLNKNGKKYLEYAHRLSLIIFIPAISISVIFYFLNINYFIDLVLCIFLIIMWCVSIYNKSKKLSLS